MKLSPCQTWLSKVVSDYLQNKHLRDLHGFGTTVLKVKISQAIDFKAYPTWTSIVLAELEELLGGAWVITADPCGIEGAEATSIVVSEDDRACLS